MSNLYNIFPKKQATTPASIVSVDDAAPLPVSKMKVALNPVQDLHGYSKPWAGGTGKNKIGYMNTRDSLGISFTYNADGSTTIDGSCSGGTSFQQLQLATYYTNYTLYPAGSYKVTGATGLSTYYLSVVVVSSTGTVGDEYYPITENQTITLTSPSYLCPRYVVTNGTHLDNVKMWPMIRDASIEDDAWEPYENECPITGRTGINTYVSPTTNLADATTYQTDWTSDAGTVYAGTVEPVTGELSSTMENIASYNGETIGEPWLSSLDEYSAGATPTTGAQVVHTLAAPMEYQLEPQDILLLKDAVNNVWPSEGTITEFEYCTDFVPGRISNAYINGRSLQEDGWYLKWRELSAPVPKIDLTSIPGKDGSIDQTEVFGDVYYEDRTLFLDMKYIGEKEWETAYSELLDAIHGQKCMVQFEKDPYWYWIARLIASNYKSKEHFLSMSGTAFPYKLYIVEESVSASVSGLVEGTAATVELAGSRMRTSPKVIVTGSVTLKWGDATKTLSAGTYYVSGLKVGKEGMTVKVWGTGTVTFKYRKGAL